MCTFKLWPPTVRQMVLFSVLTVAVSHTLLAAPASAPRAGASDCARTSRYGAGGGYGMGPGMMGGDGMGPGMMGGYSPGPGHGMGMGMGPDWARIPGINLSDEQRTKINSIADETRKAHWNTMGAIMDQQSKLRDLYGSPKQDSAAIDDVYKTIGKLRAQMYDSTVEAHKRMEAVLSKEQQETLHKYWR